MPEVPHLVGPDSLYPWRRVGRVLDTQVRLGDLGTDVHDDYTDDRNDIDDSSISDDPHPRAPALEHDGSRGRSTGNGHRDWMSPWKLGRTNRDSRRQTGHLPSWKWRALR
jgi:hypothetical protein